MGRSIWRLFSRRKRRVHRPWMYRVRIRYPKRYHRRRCTLNVNSKRYNLLPPWRHLGSVRSVSRKKNIRLTTGRCYFGQKTRYHTMHRTEKRLLTRKFRSMMNYYERERIKHKMYVTRLKRIHKRLIQELLAKLCEDDIVDDEPVEDDDEYDTFHVESCNNLSIGRLQFMKDVMDPVDEFLSEKNIYINVDLQSLLDKHELYAPFFDFATKRVYNTIWSQSNKVVKILSDLKVSWHTYKSPDAVLFVDQLTECIQSLFDTSNDRLGRVYVSNDVVCTHMIDSTSEFCSEIFTVVQFVEILTKMYRKNSHIFLDGINTAKYILTPGTTLCTLTTITDAEIQSKILLRLHFIQI